MLKLSKYAQASQLSASRPKGGYELPLKNVNNTKFLNDEDEILNERAKLVKTLELLKKATVVAHQCRFDEKKRLSLIFSSQDLKKD